MLVQLEHPEWTEEEQRREVGLRMMGLKMCFGHIYGAAGGVATVGDLWNRQGDDLHTMVP